MTLYQYGKIQEAIQQFVALVVGVVVVDNEERFTMSIRIVCTLVQRS